MCDLEMWLLHRNLNFCLMLTKLALFLDASLLALAVKRGGTFGFRGDMRNFSVSF